MLTLCAGQAESLWDEALPVEVRQLPEDMAALDELLSDPELLGPIVERWRREVTETGRAVLSDGRPTIAIETYVRLMVLKQRFRWGYRTLVAEVSDSIHLRRFCRISLSERVPDESTVRKLTRRIGAETVVELTRALIVKATREKRFRPRAVRIDSTVVEADVKHPTDAGLASHGVRALAREGRKLARRIGEKKARVRDRSRSMGRRLRAISRTIRRRSGEAKAEVLELTAQTGKLLERSVTEARSLATAARRRARGRGAGAKLKAAATLEELAERCEKVARQVRQRVKGEPIGDRIVSLSDPDARPIRKGKLGKPNEFGYVTQLAEVTENTKRGARGVILPAATELGNPTENALLPETVAELDRLGLAPREVALDGGFMPGPTNSGLSELAPERVFISGRQQPGSKRTQRRLQRYRTGAEGRISHLKRRYGLARSRLKGGAGQQIWTEWSILAYNADTLAVRTG
ncbi:MAG: transposase [Actinobacteria bacterium]|nr:transposase [Actinomycetota bacterium]MCA1697894.1 transposase [Actinomycetota bacterium]